jgi:hypothetical protein
MEASGAWLAAARTSAWARRDTCFGAIKVLATICFAEILNRRLCILDANELDLCLFFEIGGLDEACCRHDASLSLTMNTDEPIVSGAARCSNSLQIGAAMICG